MKSLRDHTAKELHRVLKPILALIFILLLIITIITILAREK